MSLQVVIAVSTLLSTAAACLTDADCSYTGACTDSVCTCDSGWTTPSCAVLDLLPLPANNSSSFYQPDTSSWCGTVIADPVAPLFHLYASEMTGHCPLGIWRSGSQVVHATAATATGPYSRREVVIAPEAHNPNVIRARDGTYILYDSYGGCSGAATNYSTCKSTAYCPCVAAGPGNFTFHSAPAPTGPWTAHTVPVDYPCHSCNLTPAPMVHANGSIFLLLHCDVDATHAVCDLTMLRADDWRGPYVTLKGGASVWNASQSPGHPEDPFMWTQRGHVHALLHNGKRAVHLVSGDGGLSFSTLNADRAPFAFTTNLTVEGGGVVALAR